MREKHGLRRDGAVILSSAGGFGVGRVDELMTSLLKIRHPAQVVAICGRNEELKARLDRLAGGLPADARVTLKVVGYTTEMDEYMAASDLVVGKPGGLTTSEAMARGLGFVVVSPIPGQEERNSDHLLEEGAAIRCNNLPVIAYKIDRLLDDPAAARSDACQRPAAGSPEGGVRHRRQGVATRRIRAAPGRRSQGSPHHGSSRAEEGPIAASKQGWAIGYEWGRASPHHFRGLDGGSEPAFQRGDGEGSRYSWICLPAIGGQHRPQLDRVEVVGERADHPVRRDDPRAAEPAAQPPTRSRR